MTQAKRNTQLYQKMFAEQEAYKVKPPTGILDHAVSVKSSRGYRTAVRYAIIPQTSKVFLAV